MPLGSLPREQLRVELEIQDPDVWLGNPSAWDFDTWGGEGVVWSEEGGWIDATCDVRGFIIERGRQTNWDDLQSTHIDLELDNSSGRYSVYGSRSWPRIRPGFGIRVIATWDGIQHPLFVGHLAEYLEGQVPEDYKVVLKGYDSFRMLADPIGVEYNPGIPAEHAGNRINRLLDAGLYKGPRAIAYGNATMTNYKTSRTLLDEIQITAMSDGGVVFVDNDGTFMFMGQERIFGRLRPVIAPPKIVTHGYLTATTGTASTPDAPGLNVTADACFVFRATFASPTTTQYLMSIWDATTAARSYMLYYDATTGFNIAWQDSSAKYQAIATKAQVTALGTGPVTLAVLVDIGSPGSVSMRRWDGTAWVPFGNVVPITLAASQDATAPLRIGKRQDGAAGSNWAGRIEMIELRTGLDPSAGTVVWRFDVDNYPAAGGTMWVDPVSGKTWTVTTADAITPPVYGPEIRAAIPAFTDSCDGGGMPYAAVEPILADHEFGNVITVTNVSQGTDSPRAAMAVDTESIIENDRYMWSPDQLVICNAEYVQALADFQLGRRSKAFYRINSFECYPVHDDRLWPALLSMRLYDSLIVQRTPPASNTITAPMICDGMRIEATPTLMKWTIRCSPGDSIEIVNFWDFANWDEDVWV